jgi:hypothetical protein
MLRIYDVNAALQAAVKAHSGVDDGWDGVYAVGVADDDLLLVCRDPVAAADARANIGVFLVGLSEDLQFCEPVEQITGRKVPTHPARAWWEACSMSDEDYDSGPLRRVALPLQPLAYEWLKNSSMLRLFYIAPGGSEEPGGALAELTVEEQSECVIVRLVERALVGTHPSGAIAAVPAVRQIECVSVAIAQSLGERRVVDGSDGRTVVPLDALSDDHGDATPCRSAPTHRGCPIWER